MTREELKAMGLTEEQISQVLDKHHSELDPVKKNLETTQEDLNHAKEKAEATQAALKEFEGLDAVQVKKQIENLSEELRKKEEAHAAELADRDFNEMLRESISSVKGKNAKAIAALLDVDKLKKSKNQKEEIAAELRALAEAEDSKMLFGEPDAKPVGIGNIIGAVGGKNEPPATNLKDSIREALEKK